MLNIIKWLGTGCVIIAAGCRAYNYHMADVILSLVGSGLWTYIGVITKDKALLTVNGFILFILGLSFFG